MANTHALKLGRSPQSRLDKGGSEAKDITTAANTNPKLIDAARQPAALGVFSSGVASSPAGYATQVQNQASPQPTAHPRPQVLARAP
eukprot:CAMPEP_0204369506 /NCGR_PEP_ID=MMETSP0469-20131031/45021_1 /ASSEMBLY_ACC=CAM_ASM_000384 /TAXON_ID=2969 /ORGANISM="Oxyrrhis marina" /LENGTH=86 /DNA_ID=CAMNT_0051359263 /DNA_START=102 /DNA_END=362 /DNA_ORIENTATION=+